VKSIAIFQKGIVDVMPLTIPVVPFGIIYGVIGVEMGLTPFMTFAMSFIIFAGSSQIAFSQLFVAGASPLVMLGSVAAINSRHFLYGAVLSQYFNKLNFNWRILLSYLMTDQAFSVSSSYLKNNQNKINAHYHMLGSGLTLWLLWQISTLAGIFLGNIVPEQLGLTFTIPLTFLALIVSELRKLDHVIVILISGTSSLVFYNYPYKIYIILSAFIALGVSYLLILRFKEIVKMIWFWIFVAGLITFFTRYSMIAFIDPSILSKNTKKVLTYVPSAVFPAIIFPAVFLNSKGLLVSIENPQIWAFMIALIIGFFFKNILLTIISGLLSFWLFIFWLS
jgi:predicted branched-subunit amino acid permease/branched-subunit amino acid transport protein